MYFNFITTDVYSAVDSFFLLFLTILYIFLYYSLMVIYLLL